MSDQESRIPDPSDHPTMTADQVAAALGISRNSTYVAIKTGEIPSIRLGSRILVPTAALRRMLALDPEAA